MSTAKSQADELAAFLKQFNEKYEADKTAPQDNSSVYMPKEPPEVTPCQWGFPCNNCGHC